MALITENQLKRLEELGAKVEEEFKEASASLETVNKSVIEMSDIIAQIKKTSSE